MESGTNKKITKNASRVKMKVKREEVAERKGNIEKEGRREADRQIKLETQVGRGEKGSWIDKQNKRRPSGENYQGALS